MGNVLLVGGKCVVGGIGWLNHSSESIHTPMSRHAKRKHATSRQSTTASWCVSHLDLQLPPLLVVLVKAVCARACVLFACVCSLVLLDVCVAWCVCAAVYVLRCVCVCVFLRVALCGCVAQCVLSVLLSVCLESVWLSVCLAGGVLLSVTVADPPPCPCDLWPAGAPSHVSSTRCQGKCVCGCVCVWATASE